MNIYLILIKKLRIVVKNKRIEENKSNFKKTEKKELK